MEVEVGSQLILKVRKPPVICFLTLEHTCYIMEVWQGGRKLWRKNLGSDEVEAMKDWDSELYAVELQTS